MNLPFIPRGYAWVSLRVADLERSVVWYANILDLAPTTLVRSMPSSASVT
jgi:catechol-2,3-dioxygenase